METRDVHFRPSSVARRVGAIRNRYRSRSPRATFHRDENILRVSYRLRRAAEYQRVPCMSGIAWRLARAQPHRGGACDQERAGAELPDPAGLAICSQKLFLSRPAEGLPDFAVR